MKLQYGSPAMKRFLTAAMALCLLLSCLVPACAQGGYRPQTPPSGICGPCASYNVEEGVLTISGAGPVTSLPSFDYLSFLDHSPIHTVIVEEGITALPHDTTLCFLPNITHVELPDSLRYVGRMAFVDTAWLDGLTDEFCIVGDGILLDYNGPGGKVVVPDTVRYISSQAFSGTDVTELVLGESVKYIGDGTWGLENTAKLETVTFVNKAYDKYAYPTMIQNNYNPWIDVKSGVDQNGTVYFNRFLVMDGVLLYYGGGPGSVTVPDAVTFIATGGIYGSPDKFTEIIIPDTVTEIAENAIQGGSLDGNKPTFVFAAADSAAQKFVENNTEWLFRFMANGQDNSSLLNFTAKEIYYSDMFKDVHEEDWFHETVAIAFELGLMNGRDRDQYAFYTFVPAGDIKLSEAITVAARVRDTYYYEKTDFTAAEGAMWYQPYVDYALANKIIAEVPEDLNRPATRAEFASMLAAALPERELTAIHEEVRFADIDEAHPAYAAIMLLSRAGVMEGKGEGRFDPDAQVKRCEAAAMLARCVRTEQRIQPDLT